MTGLSVLVLDFNVPAVMGDPGQPSFPGGVEGQRLTIVCPNKEAIFVEQSDLKLHGGSAVVRKNDALTLVLAGGVWYETGLSENE